MANENAEQVIQHGSIHQAARAAAPTLLSLEAAGSGGSIMQPTPPSLVVLQRNANDLDFPQSEIRVDRAGGFPIELDRSFFDAVVPAIRRTVIGLAMA